LNPPFEEEGWVETLKSKMVSLLDQESTELGRGFVVDLLVVDSESDDLSSERRKWREKRNIGQNVA
jgi:hypothetical protein